MILKTFTWDHIKTTQNNKARFVRLCASRELYIQKLSLVAAFSTFQKLPSRKNNKYRIVGFHLLNCRLATLQTVSSTNHKFVKSKRVRV